MSIATQDKQGNSVIEFLSNIFSLLRIKHWVKNLFLFIPIFFAGEFFDLSKLGNVGIGFVLFSFLASSVYIINDIKDVKVDRNHPKNKNRPIASGDVSIPLAIILAAAFSSVVLTVAFTFDLTLFYILLSYLLINIAYSFGLKHIAILDLFMVASGFVLRVFAGGVIADVPISQWLILMIFLLSLFLVLAKRRDDLILAKNENKVVRKASSNYNLDFTNASLTMLSAILIVSYIMYTMSDDVTSKFNTTNLYFTCAFVVAGVMRYLQITIVEEKSGSPTNLLLKDKFLIINLAAWVIMFFIIIY